MKFQRWKSVIVLCLSAFLLGVIGMTFWSQDWKYSLPTPRPRALVQPAVGSALNLDILRTTLRIAPQKPLFLHFFNPDCPCSRFNLTHIRALTAVYGSRLHFIAIVQARQASDLKSEIADCHLPMDTVIDTDGVIARRCGVYSTPQAVLLDPQGTLYYRGNYNLSRFCDHTPTQFARIAIEALLAGKPPPVMMKEATIAYGCPLPADLENKKAAP